LKALGYPESTRIYVAAGEIYGGQERMAGFFSRFPNIMKKVKSYTPQLQVSSQVDEEQSSRHLLLQLTAPDMPLSLWFSEL
jgi:hypothetical protein